MMPPAVSALLAFLVSLFWSRRALHLKILALQHQVEVYQRSVPRPRLQPADRLFWSWLSRLWAGWQEASLSSPARSLPGSRGAFESTGGA